MTEERAYASGGAIESWPQQVTKFSAWSDDVWTFAVETAGYKFRAVTWKFPMKDGSCSTDEQWQNIVESCKKFVWSLMVQNSRGAPPKALTMPKISIALRDVMQWMAESGTPNFAAIDHVAVVDFKLWLSDLKFVQSSSVKTTQTIVNSFDILPRIYEQRFALSGNPDDVMPRHPFGGESTHKVVRELGATRPSQKRPLTPDDVVLAVLNQACSWLEAPARDLQRVLDLYLLAIGNAGTQDRYEAGDDAIRDFVFDDDGSLSEPWRPSFADETYQDRGALQRPDNYKTKATPRRILFGLVKEFTIACSLVLQGLIGIRSTEICGLCSEPRNSDADWPDCLTMESSDTGLQEIFYLKGRVYKSESSFREVRWIAGARAAGTEYVPPAVGAILALDKVLVPWRDGQESRELFLSLNESNSLRDFKSGPFQIWALLRGQKAFVAKYVEITGENSDWSIMPAQWRRAFAMFMVRTDERLLAAVSDHFKHVSIAVTEQGYLDTDPELLGIIDDVDAMMGARRLAGIFDGDDVAAGPMAKMFTERKSEIEAYLATFTEAKDRIEAFHQLIRQENLRLYPAEWGECFFRPETARCHYQAQGKFQLSQRMPNYVFRRPEICSGCANLMVTQDQVEFWRKRHVSNLEVKREHGSTGEAGMALVAEERLKTSSAVLRKLGVDVAALEAKEMVHGG